MVVNQLSNIHPCTYAHNNIILLKIKTTGTLLSPWFLRSLWSGRQDFEPATPWSQTKELQVFPFFAYYKFHTSRLWVPSSFLRSLNSLELNLCQADEIEVENGEICSMTSTVEHTLITVECDYLTVEQCASMIGIEPVTVRQWIRRGN